MADALELLKSLGEKLHSSATVKNVFGDPITVGEKTVIPVARVGYGFGAGGGSNTEGLRGKDQSVQSAGGGGGGGVGVHPAGVLEITPTETRFIPFADPKRIGGALAAGFLLGVLFARRRKRSKR